MLFVTQQDVNTNRMPSDFDEFLRSSIDGQPLFPDRTSAWMAPLLTDQETNHLAHMHKEMEKLKHELQGINHERVVVDVLTRPTLSDIKRWVSTTANTPHHLLHLTHSPYQPITLSHSQPQQHEQQQRQRQQQQQQSRQTSTATAKSAPPPPYDPLANMDEAIRIPDYVPLHLRATQKLRHSPIRSQYPPMPTYAPQVTARAVGNNVTVVPNMRVGELSPDLRAIKVHSVVPLDPPPTKRRRQGALGGGRKRKVRPAVSVGGGVVVGPPREWQQKLKDTDLELQLLKDQMARANSKYDPCPLSHAHFLTFIHSNSHLQNITDCLILCISLPNKRFNREKVRADKRLKVIADMIDEKQLWKDQALLSSIDELVCQYPVMVWPVSRCPVLD
jgi:septum formation inhibitor MinC